LTLHKASEFPSPKEDDTNKEEEEKCLQLKQDLSAIDDHDKSVE